MFRPSLKIVYLHSPNSVITLRTVSLRYTLWWEYWGIPLCSGDLRWHAPLSTWTGLWHWAQSASPYTALLAPSGAETGSSGPGPPESPSYAPSSGRFLNQIYTTYRYYWESIHVKCLLVQNESRSITPTFNLLSPFKMLFFVS